MPFIRPEIAAWLRHNSEVLAYTPIFAAGILFLMQFLRTGGWVPALLGLMLLGIGGSLIRIALQRVRFARVLADPGIVQVEERRISYFGPVAGGAVALDALNRLDLIHQPEGSLWMLRTAQGETLPIPTAAQGSGALFDGFAALPDMDTTRLIAALDDTSTARHRLWQRPTSMLTK